MYICVLVYFLFLRSVYVSLYNIHLSDLYIYKKKKNVVIDQNLRITDHEFGIWYWIALNMMAKYRRRYDSFFFSKISLFISANIPFYLLMIF